MGCGPLDPETIIVMSGSSTVATVGTSWKPSKDKLLELGPSLKTPPEVLQCSRSVLRLSVDVSGFGGRRRVESTMEEVDQEVTRPPSASI